MTCNLSIHKLQIFIYNTYNLYLKNSVPPVHEFLLVSVEVNVGNIPDHPIIFIEIHDYMEVFHHLWYI